MFFPDFQIQEHCISCEASSKEWGSESLEDLKMRKGRKPLLRDLKFGKDMVTRQPVLFLMCFSSKILDVIVLIFVGFFKDDVFISYCYVCSSRIVSPFDFFGFSRL